MKMSQFQGICHARRKKRRTASAKAHSGEAVSASDLQFEAIASIRPRLRKRNIVSPRSHVGFFRQLRVNWRTYSELRRRSVFVEYLRSGETRPNRVLVG